MNVDIPYQTGYGGRGTLIWPFYVYGGESTIQLYRDSSTVTEMKIYSGLGYLF